MCRRRRLKSLTTTIFARPEHGVLVTCALSSLLWVGGVDWFGRTAPVLVFLTSLAILAGFLTQARPALTAILLAVGGTLPLNDSPPAPLALLPFLQAYSAYTFAIGPRYRSGLVVDVLLPFPVATVAAIIMAVAYGPLVYLGRWFRHWRVRRDGL